MSEPLTMERLSELRRIAEAATPGPWEWNKYLHLFSATGKPVLTKPFSDNPDVVEAMPEDLDYIETFNPETALALLNRVEQLEADNNKLECENYELYRRIERLEAKLARQRVVLRRLQVAVERRNSQERIDALRRKLSEDKRLLDRIEALEAMLLHLYQDTVVPGTGYCNRCGMIGGHDEWCAMAEVEKLLGLGGASDGEAEGGATDGR